MKGVFDGRIKIKKHIDPLLNERHLSLSRHDFYNEYQLTCDRSRRTIGGFRTLKHVFDFLTTGCFESEYQKQIKSLELHRQMMRRIQSEAFQKNP